MGSDIRRLLLDLGNTRLKMADAIGDRLLRVRALDHRRPDFQARLRSALSDRDVAAECWLAAVTPAVVTERIAASLPAHRRVRVQAEFGGLRIAYRDPQRLGVDRWLAMLGALQECRGPYLVVGAGTALTVDAVDAGGLHRGGLICPGIATMERALLARAPHLSMASNSPELTAVDFAADTAMAIASGAWQAAAGLVERSLRRWRARGVTDIEVLLCGGDAEGLSRLLDVDCRLRPDLVLQGLAGHAAASAAARSV